MPFYQPLPTGPVVDPLNSEVVIQIVLTVVTNFIGLPLSIKCFKIKEYFGGIIGLSTAFFSAMYHLADTLNARVGWMTPGNWHRLDNVFSIMAFGVLALHLMDLEDKSKFELYRWLMITFTLFCQEKGPWELLMTLLPNGTWFAAVILSYVIRRRKPRFNRNFYFGWLTMAVAFLFFGRGLDEDSDYLRLNHGLWHMFSGIAMYFFFFCLDEQKHTEFSGKKEA